jgi:hypothetical protein
MGNKCKVISYQEFSSHPDTVFESVLDGAEIVVQRGEGESITLTPGTMPNNDVVIQKKIEVILAAAGSWGDVDTETLKAQLRASRDMPPRPAVDL